MYSILLRHEDATTLSLYGNAFYNLLISFSTKTFMCCQDRKISLKLGHFEKYKSNRTQVNYYFYLNLIKNIQKY